MNKTNYLLTRIQKTEDKLSALVTKLWKLTAPAAEEQDLATDAMGQHDDNWNPTDLEILRWVIAFREDSGK